MVKIERTQTPPASLAVEKKKEENGSCGTYNQTDVVVQLNKGFHGKCYLCEQDELQSIQIEHLKPHHGGKNIDLKYDWNNLFFSCSHCNSVKNRKQYESNILDCCSTDPETMIHQALLVDKLFQYSYTYYYKLLYSNSILIWEFFPYCRAIFTKEVTFL